MSPAGKTVAIIGAGRLVGRPLAPLLERAGAFVTVCNSKTEHLKEKTLAADIIVTGVGKKHILTADMVQPGAIVIDAGVSFENGAMYGDADAEHIRDIALAVTPTPGGVGPITVARLLWNTALAAEQQHASS
jgi:methylenetetrahydrofolate dehydrogenase (NADP+)/methenyltetrahydrofolate cyclohydrolase